MSLFKLIVQNIRGFFDTNIFIFMLIFGLFTILVDYPYFKRLKYKKDAIVTYFLGVSLIILPFLLLVISRL